MPKPTIYLFYGTETFLVENKINKMINSLIPADQRALNVVSYDLINTPLEEVIQEAETLPFFSDHKFVIAKNAFLFTGQKATKGVEHDIKPFEIILEQPVDFSTIVFLVPYEKLDERKKIVKLIKKLGKVESFSSLNGKDLVEWIIKTSQKQDAKMTYEAAELIILMIGQDLQLISQEINKMAAYVGKNGLIDEKVVQELGTRKLEQNIFSLIEHVANLKIEKAFRIFYDLIKNKEEPIKMIVLYARQFRLMLHSKELHRLGYSEKQIASQLGAHPYSIKLAIIQSLKFTESQLQGILKKLAEIDYEIKTGKKEKILALEMFMFYLKGLIQI